MSDRRRFTHIAYTLRCGWPTAQPKQLKVADHQLVLPDHPRLHPGECQAFLRQHLTGAPQRGLGRYCPNSRLWRCNRWHVVMSVRVRPLLGLGPVLYEWQRPNPMAETVAHLEEALRAFDQRHAGTAANMRQELQTELWNALRFPLRQAELDDEALAQLPVDEAQVALELARRRLHDFTELDRQIRHELTGS